MEFQATARKWRPDSFQDVVAQSHVATTLTNAIKKGRIGHSYIFSGPRGVGKTTAARIFAKAINCMNPNEGNPCNECENCVDIKAGRFIDLFEIDGASNNGVDNVRDIRDALRYPPQKGKYKTYIIDEVHMLSIGAFNALLKTLEEPPSYAVFIFATTEIHKVPATILSRCQRFDFRRITTQEIMDRLRFICKEETIAADEESLLIIAKKADGAMRDGLSILDQVVSFFGKELKGDDLSHILNVVEQELFFQATELILSKDIKGMLNLIDGIINRGYDLREFIQGMAEHVRNLLVVVTTGEAKLLDISDGYRQKYMQIATHYHYSDLIRYLNLLSETDVQVKNSNNPRLKLELTMSKLCTMENSIQISELIKRLSKVEKLLEKGGHTVLKQSEPVVEYNANPVSVNPALFQPIPEQLPIPLKPANPNITYPVSVPAEKSNKPQFPGRNSGNKSYSESSVSSQPGSATASKLGFEEILSKYKVEFMNFVQTRKVSLFSMLTYTEPSKWDGRTLTLKVFRQFEENQISRRTSEISEMLQSFFKVPFFVITEFRPEEIASVMSDDVNVKFNDLKKTDPIIKYMADEFGIEPI